MSLAAALDGEINADAMAVYRHMDIGTAKPSEQNGPAYPTMSWIASTPAKAVTSSAGRLAEQAINDIHGRGKTVLVSGGSPLYVKSLLEGLSAGTPRDMHCANNKPLGTEGAEARLGTAAGRP